MDPTSKCLVIILLDAATLQLPLGILDLWNLPSEFLDLRFEIPGLSIKVVDMCHTVHSAMAGNVVAQRGKAMLQRDYDGTEWLERILALQALQIQVVDDRTHIHMAACLVVFLRINQKTRHTHVSLQLARG